MQYSLVDVNRVLHRKICSDGERRSSDAVFVDCTLLLTILLACVVVLVSRSHAFTAFQDYNIEPFRSFSQGCLVRRTVWQILLS